MPIAILVYLCLQRLCKALKYFNTFWTRLFAYTRDGAYTIDNSIAERFIRLLSGERKNSLFLGNGKMARVSALRYFKLFFVSILFSALTHIIHKPTFAP